MNFSLLLAYSFIVLKDAFFKKIFKFFIFLLFFKFCLNNLIEFKELSKAIYFSKIELFASPIK